MNLEMSKVKRIIVVICQIVLGCVFIFSGYAKAVDPYGSYYKIQDYLTAFGWDALLPLAFVAGILFTILSVFGIITIYIFRIELYKISYIHLL